MGTVITKVWRRVHFYRMVTPVDAAGVPLTVAVIPMLDHLRKLPFRDGDDGAYADGGEGTAHVAIDVKRDRLIFAGIRRSQLPRVENGQGAMRDLGLGALEGICEPIHVRFFPNAIVGADFNFYGPRMSRLESYLLRKVPEDTRGTTFSFDALFRKDPLAQLNKLKAIRMLDLKVRRAHLEELKDLDGGPFTELETIASMGNVEEVGLFLTSGRKKEASLGAKLQGLIRKLAKQKAFIAEAERMRVGGIATETERAATFDLLSDRLIMKCEMVTVDERSRVVSSASAFAAIDAAYTQLRTELEAAASLGT